MNEHRKIIILDDEDAIRQSLVFFFEDQNWEPLEAESAEKALEIIKSEDASAAIVDIRLSGMDGNSFIREAGRIKPETIYIIHTGSPQYLIPEDIRNIPGLSPKLFVKPVGDISEIEEEILRMLRIQGERKRYDG